MVSFGDRRDKLGHPTPDSEEMRTLKAKVNLSNTGGHIKKKCVKCGMEWIGFEKILRDYTKHEPNKMFNEDGLPAIKAANPGVCGGRVIVDKSWRPIKNKAKKDEKKPSDK